MRNGVLIVVDENGNSIRYVPEKPKPKPAKKSKNSTTKPKSLAEQVAAMPKCIVKLNRLKANVATSGIRPIGGAPRVTLPREPKQSIVFDPSVWLPVISSLLRMHDSRMADFITPNDIDARIMLPNQPKQTIMFDPQVWSPVISSVRRFMLNLGLANQSNQTIDDCMSNEPMQNIVFDSSVWLPVISSVPRMHDSRMAEFSTPTNKDARIELPKQPKQVIVPIDMITNIDECAESSNTSWITDSDSAVDDSNCDADDSEIDSGDDCWGQMMSSEIFNARLSDLLKNGRASHK